MLSAGEHVILDIDHWILFLQFIETHPEKEKFWNLHKEVCRAHAEQFKHKLFNAESIAPKKFVRIELEEIFAGMGFIVEIKEDFSKLRIKVVHDL